MRRIGVRKMDLNLKGKVALVTGGSRGLGKTICLKLASEGVSVAVNYRRSADEAAEVVEEIKSTCGVGAIAIPGDVASEADVIAMFDKAEDEFSQIDILVNNAGICPVALIKDMPAEMWTRTIATNLTGTFLTSREMIRRLLAADRPGRIVNVASQAAFNGSATG